MINQLLNIRIWPMIVMALLTAAARADDRSVVVSGDARFTVITPNLIRIEDKKGGEFTDSPTMFGYDRARRFADAKIIDDAKRVEISTAAIHLIYTPDGKPLGASNLVATIQRDGNSVEWKPGQDDPENLGGTLRTLDGVNGPRDVGKGLISRSGWAVVDDSGMPVLTSDWVKARPNREETDWYLFGYGHDYQAAFNSLAAISGPVPLPRRNLLGLWYSRYWPWSSDDYKRIVKEYDDHRFPLDNIVMDMDWHLIEIPGSNNHMIWTGYTFNKKLIPDFAELAKWFHKEGLAVTLNDHPADGVQPHESMYADFMRAMHADPSKTNKIPYDTGDKHYMDTFWQYTHAPLDKEGVDFWWLDWQQEPNVKSIPGLTNLAWLNKFYFDKTSTDGKRGVSFSRWAGWGDHRYPIEFSGDAHTGFPSLAFEVPFTSTAGNVGCFFWSHDIGGHQGGRNEESYARWCQFGALSTALRSHSTRDPNTDRRPWAYPQWAEDSMRDSFQLRSKLMPYVYSSVAETCTKTIPLVRPLYLEHPDQEEAYHVAHEYYFGDNLLVAPLATAGTGPSRLAWNAVWFPQGSGTWHDYFTGERHAAGSTSVVACDISTFPLFVRAGVPLPMRPYSSRPTGEPISELVLRCYPGEEGKTGSDSLYEDDGQTLLYKSGKSATTALSYQKSGKTISIHIAPTVGEFDGQLAERSYTIELPCLEQPTRVTVDGAEQSVEYDAKAFIARVRVAARPIRQGATVVIEANELPAETMHANAVAARILNVAGNTLQTSINDLFANALQATTDASLHAAIFASAGVAVVPTNDSPTLYHGTESLKFVCPDHLIDDNMVKISLVATEVEGRATPVTLMNGATLDSKAMSQLRDALPIEDDIAVEGRRPKLKLSLSVKGQPIEAIIDAPAALGIGLRDLARSAKATASSTEPGYHVSSVNDGIAAGYPGDRDREWSSNKQRDGAAVTLTWKEDQSASHVLLYDRPNANDDVLAGKLVFSDGSSQEFGPLPADGKTPLKIDFPAKTIRWVRVEITKVSDKTEDAGLAEVAVFK